MIWAYRSTIPWHANEIIPTARRLRGVLEHFQEPIHFHFRGASTMQGHSEGVRLGRSGIPRACGARGTAMSRGWWHAEASAPRHGHDAHRTRWTQWARRSSGMWLHRPDGRNDLNSAADSHERLPPSDARNTLGGQRMRGGAIHACTTKYVGITKLAILPAGIPLWER